MKRELKERVVRAVLRKKILDRDKKQDIRIQPGECKASGGESLFNLNEINELGDLLHDIEEKTDGVIRLLSPVAKEETEPERKEREFKFCSENNLMEYFGDDGSPIIPSMYFLVRYDPSRKQIQVKRKKKDEKHIFYLSEEKGLYRPIKGKAEKSYPVTGQRYEILNALTKKFQKPEEVLLKISSKTIRRADPQVVRTQIGNIREILGRKFEGVTPEEMIVGNQNQGYRWGTEYLIKKER